MKNQWFASVMLTVLLSVSGAAYAQDNNAPHGDKQGQCHHHHVQFTDQQKQLLHSTMKSTLEKDKPLFQKMHDLHKQLHDIVKAPTFDAQAFEDLNMKIESTRDQIHRDRVDAFASIAGQFTPEEREAIIRHSQHHHHHYRHGMNDKDGHGEWKHGPDGNKQQGSWGQRDKAMTPRDQSVTPSDQTMTAPTEGVVNGGMDNGNSYPPYNNR